MISAWILFNSDIRMKNGISLFIIYYTNAWELWHFQMIQCVPTTSDDNFVGVRLNSANYHFNVILFTINSRHLADMSVKICAFYRSCLVMRITFVFYYTYNEVEMKKQIIHEMNSRFWFRNYEWKWSKAV